MDSLSITYVTVCGGKGIRYFTFATLVLILNISNVCCLMYLVSNTFTFYCLIVFPKSLIFMTLLFYIKSRQPIAPYVAGAMFAFLGSLGSLSGITGTTLYNNIYPLTLKFWPGLCFLLGVIISIIPMGLTGQVYTIQFYLQLPVADLGGQRGEVAPPTPILYFFLHHFYLWHLYVGRPPPMKILDLPLTSIEKWIPWLPFSAVGQNLYVYYTCCKEVP